LVTLRALMTGLPGAPYGMAQASYDLARLRRNGLITRRPHANTYDLTADGLAFAIFYTKVQDRVLAPLFAAGQPQAPPQLRAALTAIQRHIDDRLASARLPMGLANSHAGAARDFDAMRSHAAGREELVDEIEAASTAGLRRAPAMLASALVPDDERVAELARGPRPDPEQLRRAVLSALRHRHQTGTSRTGPTIARRRGPASPVSPEAERLL
jgi:hypothetical protein